MTEAEKITNELRKNIPQLKERYNIRSLGLFGSHVRGEQQSGSDVDILVEFEDSPSLLKFIALERHLSDLIGRKVDLVMKSALKPEIGEHILEEVVSI